MEYLSVQEAAELKGCTARYIKRIIQEGKLTAESELNEKNKKKYRIPLSALPEELQVKYYKQNGIEIAAAPPEKKASAKPQKNLDYEKLSNEQREEVSLWIRILEDWQIFVCTYEGAKTEANKAFVQENSEKYEVKISVDILYRKRRI